MSEVTSDPRPGVDLLRCHRRVLVTSHAAPDGDAIGSALGLAEFITLLGGEAQVVMRDPASANLRFLPGCDRITILESLPEAMREASDLIAVLECPGLDRPGLASLDRWPILNIDHHLGNPGYGVVNYLDEKAPAVGEMVLRMVECAGVALTPTLATNLYTALVTDTGDFRYSSVTARAFGAAARLVEGGAVPYQIADALWDHTPARIVRLTAAVLATLSFAFDGQLATITLDRTTLEHCGALPEDTENLVNIPRSIDGVRVAAFFKALTAGTVRVSLRSRGDFDVQAVAQIFAGGGHTNAAGCTIHGSLDDARAAVSAALRPALETA